MYQRAPVGIWRSSPQRRVLWAVKQVLLRIERAIPDQPKIDKWALRLKQRMAGPVLKFNWERWYRENAHTHLSVGKAKDTDPKVPAEIAAAWDKLPAEIRQLWEEAAKARVKAEGLPFPEDAMKTALDSTMHLIVGVSDTQKQMLREMMATALENSEGQYGFAKRIRQEFSDFAVSRARLVAVTEWNRGASTATFEAYKAAGVASKQWYTAGDDRVCPVCEMNAAEAEIPLQQEFSSGDQFPPAHPGCRCDISGV